MKKLSLLLAALLTGVALSAQTPAPAPAPAANYTVTVDFPYASKYVFRGIQYAKDSLQPSVKLTVGGFYAGIWSNAPLDRGYELELDYFTGYNFALKEGWTLDLGATLYSYPGLSAGDKTTFEPYLGLNGSLGAVSSATYLYYDTTIEVFTAQQTFSYSVPLDDKVPLTFAATLGHASPDSGSGYTYYGLGATLPFKLSDKATFTLGAQYASHDLDGVEDNHFWGTAGFTYTF
ncbi:MAG: hypothetical protein JNG82_14355 [Opitutaceae bacterium]|nr:hypothetical protein [Opitutaceae bacterium]